MTNVQRVGPSFKGALDECVVVLPFGASCVLARFRGGGLVQSVHEPKSGPPDADDSVTVPPIWNL